MLFMLFVHVISLWHVYRIQLRAVESFKRQCSVEVFGLVEKSLLLHVKTIAQDQVDCK